MHKIVLGASGFIGKNLSKKLLSCNEDNITLFDMIKPEILELKKTNCRYIKGTFHNDYNYIQLLKNQDIVFHLISTTVPSSKKSYVDEIKENIFSTLNLLEACVKNGVKKIVFISSGGTIYGESKGVPFKEGDQNNPICSYGIQKLMIEKYLHLYYHLYGLNYSVIRLSNPYGPGQNPNGPVGAVTIFLNKVLNHQPIVIYGDGTNIRDYIYIDDAIQGIVNISDLSVQEKVFNLGSGVGTSLIELIKIIEYVTGEKAEIIMKPSRNEDLSYSVLNVEKYKTYFCENKLLSIEEGIKKMLSEWGQNK